MITELIALLFASRDYGHRAHLKTRSYSQHTALEAFYSQLTDLADKLTEAYQGRYEIIEIPYLEGETNPDVVEVLTRHLAMVEAVRYQAIPEKDSVLQNIVDEVCGVYLSSLYKLKNLA